MHKQASTWQRMVPLGIVVLFFVLCLAWVTLGQVGDSAAPPVSRHTDPTPSVSKEETEDRAVSEVPRSFPGVPNEASVARSVSTADTGPLPQGVSAEVVSVVDGDTIDLRIAGVIERVRYIGIDTPETVHPGKSVQCFGREASAKNKELVLGKVVELSRDVTDRDRYGRLLRYVYVDGVMVNEVLVRGGYASVYTYPPDVKYDARFRKAEQLAREEEAGLWGDVCDSYIPVAPVSTPVSAPNPDCVIKGNINGTGEKIYHAPGCKSYEKTTIREEEGEQWFCTEKDAVRAGWRKALNC